MSDGPKLRDKGGWAAGILKLFRGKRDTGNSEQKIPEVDMSDSYEDFGRFSKDWCSTLAMEIMERYAERGTPWPGMRDLVEIGEEHGLTPDYIRDNAWFFFCEHVQHPDVSGMPSIEHVIQTMKGIPQADIEGLFQSAKTNAFISKRGRPPSRQR